MTHTYRWPGAHVVLADQFALERSSFWVRDRFEYVVTIQTSNPLSVLVDRDKLLHVQRNIHSKSEVPFTVAQIHFEKRSLYSKNRLIKFNRLNFLILNLYLTDYLLGCKTETFVSDVFVEFYSVNAIKGGRPSASYESTRNSLIR